MKLSEDKHEEPKKSEYTVDIKRLPDFELLEIYERQAKIIRNKNLINKLPDRGQKLMEKNKHIEDELELRKRTTDDIITSISELSIGTKVKDKLSSEKNNTSLSSSCSSLSHEGSSTVEVPLSNGSSSTIPVDRFAFERSGRMDHVTRAHRFIPAQSAKTREPSSRKDYEEKDLSAACLPRGKFDVVQVPLTEVVKLKGRETVYIKELEIKEAQDRLTSLEFGSTPLTALSYTPMNYRSAPDHDPSDDENEDTPVLDEDEDDRVGTVSFTVQE